MPSNKETKTRPTRVLLIMARTRSKRNEAHTYPSATPLLIRLLHEAGCEVHLSTNLDRVRGRDLSSFDVILLHGIHSNNENDPAIEALDNYVRHTGRGLIVIHVASNSFTPYNRLPPPRWIDLVGSSWVYAEEGNPIRSDHPPPSAIEVTVEQTKHPIMIGVDTNFTVSRDELYQNMAQSGGGPGVRLATGVVDDNASRHEEPIAFAREVDNGRVFYLYLGHFCSTYVNPNITKMISQGVKWCDTRLQ